MERAEFQRELAREIHDGIQHLLITLGKRLELAQPLILEAPARAVQIVEEERETARRAADELRYLVRRLRSGPTRHADLATALRLQVAALAERFPYAIDLVLPPALPRLQPAPEHALLRCIQESLTNVAKHARAAHVEVRLGVSEDALACTITDDGVGFDPAGTASAGLEGLRERVRALGGVLEVRSAPGAGTTVTTRIPLRENTR
jgi:signal transduction histidine kinase